MRTALVPLLVLGLFGGSLLAQGGVAAPETAVTGVVLPAGPSICSVNATHKLDCTIVQLRSDNVDLDGLIGHNVKLLGNLTDIGAPGCVLLNVTAVINVPPTTLTMCGTPAIGCPVRFVICPPGLSQFWLFAGLAPGFAPLDPFKGSWLLGDPSFLLLSGFLDIACARIDVTIPSEPNLVGVEVWMQSARKEFSPGIPFQLGNAICFQILPGSVIPCGQPNC